MYHIRIVKLFGISLITISNAGGAHHLPDRWAKISHALPAYSLQWFSFPLDWPWKKIWPLFPGHMSIAQEPFVTQSFEGLPPEIFSSSILSNRIIQGPYNMNRIRKIVHIWSNRMILCVIGWRWQCRKRGYHEFKKKYPKKKHWIIVTQSLSIDCLRYQTSRWPC